MLCLYTIVFGRFFCGFACAFGTLGDFVREFYVWICKKVKRKSVGISDSINKRLSVIKYFILTIIILLCFAGVYSGIKGWSPWDVFFMIIAGNLKISGYVPALIILLFIIVGMAVCERFFCRFLCPMGAVFSILSVLTFFSISRNREQCIKGCSGCTKVCPSKIELPDLKEDIQPGDCFMCQKCMNICPKQNVKLGLVKGNGITFIIVRGLILILIMKWAGI